MTWNEASELLTIVEVGQHLDPDNGYKIVVEVPPYQCANYDNAVGYRIQVGANSFANIPLFMLQTLLEAASDNDGIYNRAVFAANYPQQLKNRPCHVHAIGKLFSNAGVMNIVNANNYQIVDEA